MSPVAVRRFVVTGFDHDMWRMIVPARTAAEAAGKVFSLLAADCSSAGMPFSSCGNPRDWQIDLLGERQ